MVGFSAFTGMIDPVEIVHGITITALSGAQEQIP
jgi:hypothetical protein